MNIIWGVEGVFWNIRKDKGCEIMGVNKVLFFEDKISVYFSHQWYYLFDILMKNREIHTISFEQMAKLKSEPIPDKLFGPISDSMTKKEDLIYVPAMDMTLVYIFFSDNNLKEGEILSLRGPYIREGFSSNREKALNCLRWCIGNEFIFKRSEVWERRERFISCPIKYNDSDYSKMTLDGVAEKEGVLYFIVHNPYHDDVVPVHFNINPSGEETYPRLLCSRLVSVKNGRNYPGESTSIEDILYSLPAAYTKGVSKNREPGTSNSFLAPGLLRDMGMKLLLFREYHNNKTGEHYTSNTCGDLESIDDYTALDHTTWMR